MFLGQLRQKLLLEIYTERRSLKQDREREMRSELRATSFCISLSGSSVRPESRFWRVSCRKQNSEGNKSKKNAIFIQSLFLCYFLPKRGKAGNMRHLNCKETFLRRIRSLSLALDWSINVGRRRRQPLFLRYASKVSYSFAEKKSNPCGCDLYCRGLERRSGGWEGQEFSFDAKVFTKAQKMADWKEGIGGKHGREGRYCSPFSKNFFE